MTVRYAIYYAPARDSLLMQAAESWLAQPDLAARSASARRYGFHATIQAPMTLEGSYEALKDLVETFAAEHLPVALDGLAPRLIERFLALTTEPQPRALTDFAADAVNAFDAIRAPLSAAERERRLRAPLTPRQIELVDRYGYPYVLDEFRFHMTLSDRLPAEDQAPLLDRARSWFTAALAEPVRLDRLVIFVEPEPGAAFRRLDPDFMLRAA